MDTSLMKKNLFFVVPLVFGIIFSSCVTTNQTVIEKNQFDGELQDFELEFARLDGAMLLKKNAAFVSEAEKLCSKIEFALNDSSLSSSALARALLSLLKLSKGITISPRISKN